MEPIIVRHAYKGDTSSKRMKVYYRGEKMKTSLVVIVCCVFMSPAAVAKTANTELEDLLQIFEVNDHSDHGQQRVNKTAGLLIKTVLNRILCVQQGFTNHECLQCFNGSKFVDATDAKASATTVEQLSVLVLHQVLTFRSACSPKSAPACERYVECRKELRQRLLPEKRNVLDSLEDSLRILKAVYQPVERDKCFSAESALKHLNVTPEAEDFTEKIAAHIMKNVVQGNCIDVGEAVTDFMEDLFHRYGDKSSQTITSNGLSKLLVDLNIGGVKSPHELHHKHNETEDDDDHDHDHDEETHDNHHHDHASDDHDHKVAYAILLTNTSGVLLPHRRKRHQEHQHGSLASRCLSPESLFKKFSHSTTGALTQSEFLQLCPALVQQHVSRVCNLQGQEVTEEKKKPPKWQLWVYSSIAVLIISLCSCVVVVILPLMGKSIYPYLMIGLLGVAYGTMSGDAMLHLIPQVLELHSHDSKDDHHHHEHHEHDHIATQQHKHDVVDAYFWKQIGLLITVYVIFLFETILGMVTKTEKPHSHSHIPTKPPAIMSVHQEQDRLKNKSESNIELTMNTNSTLSLSNEASDDEKEKETRFTSPNVCFGLKSLALVVTIGDTIHNFGDGLAIGAAFSDSIQGGLSTSFAVFCHELPHEFGDFVILLSTGLSFKKALLINFLSALSCFVGLYIGIPLGEDRLVRLWVLTITAGIFLYVALVEMLPELKNSQGKNKVLMFFIKNIGILIGTASMVCIGLFEDKLHL